MSEELKIIKTKQWNEEIIHFPNWIQSKADSNFARTKKDKSISFCIYNLLIIKKWDKVFFQNSPFVNIYSDWVFVTNMAIPENTDFEIPWEYQKLPEESIKSPKIKEEFLTTDKTRWELTEILFNNYRLFLADLAQKLISENSWLYLENAIATPKPKQQTKEKSKDILEEIERLVKNKDLESIKKLLLQK